MNIKRKILLSIGISVLMLVALVTGIVCLNNNNSTPIIPAGSDNTGVKNPTSYTFRPGQVQLAGTNIDKIDFKYEPSVNSSEEATPTVKAYEYIFGRPESVDETMAVTIKPIVEVDGIDVCYVYSDEELDFSEEITAKTKFEAQTITTKGADIYIYLLVVATNVLEPVDFTTNITWNFGNAGTVTYNVNGETITETIVKGQDLPEPEIPTAPTGYYFDAWFTDAEFTQFVSFPLESQGQQLYARFHNFPLNSTSYMTYNNGSYSVTGNPYILDLIIPTIYNDGTNGNAFVTSIGDGLFDGFDVLTSIDFPTSLTNIGDSAFSRCYNLRSVNLSDCTSLTSIGDSAFSSSSGLTSVTLPSSITSIGDSAFASCFNLTNIDLSNCTSLTNIGDYAFASCSNLTNIDLSGCASLTSVGDSAFASCSNLTNIDLSNCTSLTNIGKSVFSSCRSLTSVTLPGDIASIGDFAFAYSGLTSIDLSVCTSLTSIGESAFEGCELTNVDLSNCTSLISIGNYAFSYGWTTSIIIPASVTKIGCYVFVNSRITTVSFEDISTWYAVDNETDWNNYNIANAIEVEGLVLGESGDNATVLNNYSSKYLFRVD